MIRASHTASRNTRALWITEYFFSSLLDSEKAYGPFYCEPKNIIAPIPTTLKPLITVEGQPQGVIACGVLVGADLVFDGANGGLAFCEDWF